MRLDHLLCRTAAGFPASQETETGPRTRKEAHKEITDPDGNLRQTRRTASADLKTTIPVRQPHTDSPFELVAMARTKHPFPSRTRRLRASAAMILHVRMRESSSLPALWSGSTGLHPPPEIRAARATHRPCSYGGNSTGRGRLLWCATHSRAPHRSGQETGLHRHQNPAEPLPR